MWKTVIQDQENRNALKHIISQNDVILSFAEVLQLWQNNEAFRNYFISLLKDAPYKAFFWETPPVKKSNLDKPFEFVLVNSINLPFVSAERRAFSEHFAAAGSQPIVSFMNLGKNARLVVPCPLDDTSSYPHLAAFIRNAPEEQLHQFWTKVGYHMENHISERNTWLSTAGLGVYWLHVRLDARPKYYRFEPYKRVD